MCTTSTSQVINGLWKNYKDLNKHGFSITFKFGNTTLELPIRDDLNEEAFKYSVSSLINATYEQK